MINAPTDRVFDYLADFRRHADWDGDARLAVVATSPGPLGVGSWCRRSGRIRPFLGLEEKTEAGAIVPTIHEKKL
ncbi:MAG: hypothetical protein IH956_04925 [Chloroflexi bacterium]|nr:hypothetical protein [Chloroflexota bacterium]